MTTPSTSFLDFFVLEAGEYVEQLDGILLRAAGGRAPDAEGLQRAARALRGSATMAKLQSFADLASAVEAIGRTLKQGALPWDASLKGVLTATIDDFKILLRAVRNWSPAEDQRAMQRGAEIAQIVRLPTGNATPIMTSGITFFANEATSIASGLELLANRPEDRTAGANVLAKVRALRGVAGVKDVPALAEVLEAAETAIRPLEMGDAKLSPENVNLLRASSELLRTIAAGLSSNNVVTSSTPQYKAFLAALDGVVAHTGGDRVIPIADLFYNDAGPHIVNAASNPPTTPGQRFRMEVVSLGEHLHRVIDEARGANDAIQQEHAKAELGRALRAIRATASSFGQIAVAQTVEAYLERTGDLNAEALTAISQFAGTISPAPISTPRHVGAVPLRETHQREVVAAIGTQGPLPSFPAPAQPSAHARVFDAQHAPPVPTPPVAAAVTRASRGTPALDSAIAAFDSLADERMAEPRVIDEVIPIDELYYRGRAALDRAVMVRDAIKRAGSPPPQHLLDELYDLVELARAEQPF
jgi:HPt (histidine-containing phosphotransfer) domain-containing protein